MATRTSLAQSPPESKQARQRRLFLAALTAGMTGTPLGGGRWAVSSASRPGVRHSVEHYTDGDGTTVESCTCERGTRAGQVLTFNRGTMAQYTDNPYDRCPHMLYTCLCTMDADDRLALLITDHDLGDAWAVAHGVAEGWAA